MLRVPSPTGWTHPWPVIGCPFASGGPSEVSIHESVDRSLVTYVLAEIAYGHRRSRCVPSPRPNRLFAPSATRRKRHPISLVEPSLYSIDAPRTKPRSTVGVVARAPSRTSAPTAAARSRSAALRSKRRTTAPSDVLVRVSGQRTGTDLPACQSRVPVIGLPPSATTSRPRSSSSSTAAGTSRSPRATGDSPPLRSRTVTW